MLQCFNIPNNFDATPKPCFSVVLFNKIVDSLVISQLTCIRFTCCDHKNLIFGSFFRQSLWFLNLMKIYWACTAEVFEHKHGQKTFTFSPSLSRRGSEKSTYIIFYWWKLKKGREKKDDRGKKPTQNH